jgi:hypothetical protein
LVEVTNEKQAKNLVIDLITSDKELPYKIINITRTFAVKGAKIAQDTFNVELHIILNSGVLIEHQYAVNAATGKVIVVF